MGLSIGRTKTPAVEPPKVEPITLEPPKVNLEALQKERDEYELDLQRKREKAKKLQEKAFYANLLAEAKDDLSAALDEAGKAQGAVDSAWTKEKKNGPEISAAQGRLGKALESLGKAISRVSQLGG